MFTASLNENATDLSELLPRERILQTAHDLFYQDGIRATGIDKLIEKSQVTKTTFYRKFPSKKALIIAFLDHRHQRWMVWFEKSLNAHGGGAAAICPTLSEWFHSADFRGCAFINSLGELGGEMPEVVASIKRHKQEMTNAIERVLPRTRGRKKAALALGMAIDGAIIRAQFDDTPKTAIALLKRIIEAELQ